MRRAMVAAGALLIALGAVGVGRSLQAPSPTSTRPADALLDDLRRRPPPKGEAANSDPLATLQAQVKENPTSSTAWAALGAAYLEQARVSGDPSWYPKAKGSLDRSFEIRRYGNLPAAVGNAALAAARHDFAGALEWAERATAIDAEDPGALAVLGDAMIELGRYEEAFKVFQRMVDARPDIASYARVSYARELQGDVDGAIVAMEAAEDAATGPADAAFAHYQLGELYWNRGDLDQAEVHYRRAAAIEPRFVASEAALARMAWARGDTDEAITAYRTVVSKLPAPQYVIELSDLLTVAGRPEEAREHHAVLEAQQRISEANGVNVDVEVAIYAADHRAGLDEALNATRAQWDGGRRSIVVADALAWLLHAQGRHTEALALSDQALRLGTNNALFHFHRAKIEMALGQPDAARRDLERALAINPHFSILHAREAARLVASPPLVSPS